MCKYDVYINSDNGVNKPQNSLSSSKVMGDKNCFIVRWVMLGFSFARGNCLSVKSDHNFLANKSMWE